MSTQQIDVPEGTAVWVRWMRDGLPRSTHMVLPREGKPFQAGSAALCVCGHEMRRHFDFGACVDCRTTPRCKRFTDAPQAQGPEEHASGMPDVQAAQAPEHDKADAPEGA